jgi:ferredoxin--NADP+ reductase
MPVHQPDTIPSNIYKPKSPLKATIVSNTRITHPTSPNEVRHITISLEGSEFKYLAGQSVGVLPYGTSTEGDAPSHKLRLYSIAAPSWGDDGNGNTVSLCVKRLVYHTEAGEEVQGVCSNYLSNLNVGDPVMITGPVGKSFLLPPDEHHHMIMVGTGTGIAPFRGFLHERFKNRHAHTGQTHLFFGAQSQNDFLYKDELNAFEENENFHLHTAFSREELNNEGGRMYVQHKLYENREELLKLLLEPNTYFYVCGLRGMEDGILEAMKQAAIDSDIDWNVLLASLKSEHRWHIEVY